MEATLQVRRLCGPAADFHHTRKLQFARLIRVWPWPEHYRKRTCRAEPVAQLALAAVRNVSLSRPDSMCASTATCGENPNLQLDSDCSENADERTWRCQGAMAVSSLMNRA